MILLILIYLLRKNEKFNFEFNLGFDFYFHGREETLDVLLFENLII